MAIAPTSTNDRIVDQQAPNDAFVDTQVAQVTPSENINAVIDQLRNQALADSAAELSYRIAHSS